MKKETKNEKLYNILTSTNVLDDKEFRRIMYGTTEKSVKLWELITNCSNVLEHNEQSKENMYSQYIKCIVDGMEDYLTLYPAPPMYKQKIWNTFKAWIERIVDKYNIKNVGNIIETLSKPVEKELSIEIVKALHNQEGVTKEDLAEQLDVATKCNAAWCVTAIFTGSLFK